VSGATEERSELAGAASFRGPGIPARNERDPASNADRHSDTLEPLILDLLEWIGPDARPYAEVMDVWKTSCPRLPVWEDANDRGFITRQRELVSVTASGRDFLRMCSARRDRVL
jgi:hypothetical protein